MKDFGPWGWLKDPFVWIVIVLVIAVVVLSVLYGNFKSDIQGEKCIPPFQPPPIVFSIVWAFLYLGLLIAGVIAVWRTLYSSTAMLVVFGAIMLYTLAWVLTYSQPMNSGASLIMMLGIIIFSMLFVVLAQPDALGGSNSFVRKFPSVMICIFLIWIFIATYLNVGTLVLNSEVMKPIVGDCGKKPVEA